MSILTINSVRYASSFSQFRFHFFSSQKSLFSRTPSNLSQKNDNLELIHHRIIVKFKHQVRNSIPSILTDENYKNMSKLREKPFLFSCRNLKLSL